MLSTVLSLLACVSMNSARPLNPGEHAAALTVGGPLLEFGGAPIPIPNVVAQGRSGLPLLAGRPTDLHYGLNLTAAAFGVAAVHVGATHLLLDQRGGVPALSVTERLHGSTNLFDPRKAIEHRAFWGINELELTASWRAGGQHLVYAGLNQALDFSAPELLLSPFVGLALDPGAPGGLGVQIEGRAFAANHRPEADVVRWVGPARGALGFSLGLSWRTRPDAEATP